MSKPNLDRQIFEIRTAKDSKQTPEACQQLFSSLTSILGATFWERFMGDQPTISFEIASLNQRVFFIVTVEGKHAALIKSQIVAQYPTAVITQMEDYLPAWSQYGQPSVGQLVLSGPNYLPIKAYHKNTSTDPMASVLGVLGKTPPGSGAVVQITLCQAQKTWTATGKSLIKRGVSPDPTIFKAHPQQMLIEEKISFKAFEAVINLFATHPDQSESRTIISQIASSFNPYGLNDGNGFSFQSPKNPTHLLSDIVNRSAKAIPKNHVLNIQELATIYHFPTEVHADLRNIAWGKTIKGEAPDNLPVADNLTKEEFDDTAFFAKTEFKNQVTEFGIKLKDRRRHFYVLGKSGTGKSTLLGNMAIEDLQKGRGFAVIDPHGELIEETILHYVPENRMEDIVYLDPSDSEHPFHLNPLETKKDEYKDLTVSNIMSIFTKIWANVWSARMEYILRNTLATLVEVKGSTMLDIPAVLTDKKFRDELLTKVDPVNNRVIHDFWIREYNQYNDKFQQEAIAPILNKVGQFLASPTIRSILREPQGTINIEQLMNSGKVVLVNLSQGRIGEENAALLGAIFITQFQLAAMNRVNIPQEERKDFFLYVDEFQNFATTSFVKILSEARKYRLGLILANQYTAQVPEEVQKAIFGNIGTIVTFVMGANDASIMMQEYGALYTQEDLVNLGKHQIITKLSIDDRISPPFPAITLAPLPGRNDQRDRVVEISRSLYTKKAEAENKTFIITTTNVTQDEQHLPPTPPPMPKKPLEKPEVGKTYTGKVTNIKDYGIFVEILPEVQGLVHVSNMSKTYLKSPSDLVKKGDEVKVKLYEIDAQNRLNLTMILEEKPTPKESIKTPNLDDLVLTKKDGYVPTAVACLIREKKVLLAFKKDHNLWQLPQGGVDDKDTLEIGLIKKLKEKLDLTVNQSQIVSYLGDSKLEFAPLPEETLRNTPQKGKHYFGFAVDANTIAINKPGIYDQITWASHQEATKLVKKTAKGTKLQITLEFLELLKKQQLID